MQRTWPGRCRVRVSLGHVQPDHRGIDSSGPLSRISPRTKQAFLGGKIVEFRRIPGRVAYVHLVVPLKLFVSLNCDPLVLNRDAVSWGAYRSVPVSDAP